MNYETLWQRLTDIYETGEAKAIVRLALEVRFGLTMTDILCGKIEKFTSEEQKDLKHIIQRLETGEPVQYVLGEAEFGGRTFHVEPGVLIPRPETYELCKWIMDDGRWKKEDERNASILDIGTGSGCIACTLAAEMPDTEVTAWDISDEALRIATENAKRTNVHVSFKKVDVLNTPLLYKKGMGMGVDIIVSNPPYIPDGLRGKLQAEVEREPALALFAGAEGLDFYRRIAREAPGHLPDGGWLCLEAGDGEAAAAAALLKNSFTEIRILPDLNGLDRVVSGRLSIETFIQGTPSP
jgi:release factor glutamine methyltransferase